MRLNILYKAFRSLIRTLKSSFTEKFATLSKNNEKYLFQIICKRKYLQDRCLPFVYSSCAGVYKILTLSAMIPFTSDAMSSVNFCSSANVISSGTSSESFAKDWKININFEDSNCSVGDLVHRGPSTHEK